MLEALAETLKGLELEPIEPCQVKVGDVVLVVDVVRKAIATGGVQGSGGRPDVHLIAWEDNPSLIVHYYEGADGPRMIRLRSPQLTPSPQERIKKALELATSLAGFDGGNKKAHAIDQMVRALTGCPMVTREALDCNKKPYTYETQGESDEYRDFIADYCHGEDGPHTYEWDEGVPP